jgi:hypothetical protein
MWARPTDARAERVVFLGGGLSAEDTVVFTAAVAASGHPGVVLLDHPKSRGFAKAFLGAFGPERVVPVGLFPERAVDLERRLGVPTTPVLTWQRGPPTLLWQALFPRAPRVVVCPSEPNGLLLQAACLAGAVRAPLFVWHDEPSEAAELRRWLVDWRTREVFLAGAAVELIPDLPDVGITRLADEGAVAACYLRHQERQGPLHSLVVANPFDGGRGLSAMSALAPYVAFQQRAALLLTNEQGTDTAEVIGAALETPSLRRAETLTLVADLEAVPMDQRPNPVAGKDPYIEMEPMTPAGSEPYSFATGRLFHDEPAVVALMLARKRLLADAPRPAAGSPWRALVVSNASGGLPLLEAFSRNTTNELSNAGYQTMALFGDDVNKDVLRQRLPDHDIFLWEGHHNTLIKDYGFPTWTEPLPPSFVFLQSCLALTETKVQPLLRRGSVGVVGSSTRIYSASGGAFALAYFDALVYEHQSLGGALRQAKNFLQAYARLKEKRLGKHAKLSGANLRTSWAFTLWGDPTLRLPRPEPAAEARAAVRHRVQGNTIVVTLPDEPHDRVVTGNFRTEMPPNARLAGLVRKTEGGRHLVPIIFAEVALPQAPPGKAPRLHSRLPSSCWVFSWDDRRRCGYLLAIPRPKDPRELHFHVTWTSPEPKATEPQQTAARVGSVLAQ